MSRRELLAEIRADCETDAQDLSESPSTVNRTLGHMLAMISAIATVVESLIPEDRPITEVAIEYGGRPV